MCCAQDKEAPSDEDTPTKDRRRAEREVQDAAEEEKQAELAVRAHVLQLPVNPLSFSFFLCRTTARTHARLVMPSCDYLHGAQALKEAKDAALLESNPVAYETKKRLEARLSIDARLAGI